MGNLWSISCLLAAWIHGVSYLLAQVYTNIVNLESMEGLVSFLKGIVIELIMENPATIYASCALLVSRLLTFCVRSGGFFVLIIDSVYL